MGRDDESPPGALAARLGGPGREALARLSDGDLLAAWAGAVAAFRDPGSRERRRLDDTLAAAARLSPAGLAAGLDAVLGGVDRAAAAAVVERAAALRPLAPATPVLVVLAGNLPGLAVQPLLPALALRRPVLLKSSSAETSFAPAWVSALTSREPVLGEALAACSWRGGDESVEAPVLAAVGRILAYGDEPALAELERRALGRVVAYGPKLSFAAVARGHESRSAPGLARDVALFDQRGCLSVHCVATDGDPDLLAEALALQCTLLASRWAPGPPTLAEAAAARQVRDEAALSGLASHALVPLAAGTVIVDPRPAFRPSPGLRTVRILPLADLEALPGILAPWAGRLQGAALAGAAAWALAPALEALGVSRFALPGELQSPDATWHNGGVDPLAVLASGT